MSRFIAIAAASATAMLVTVGLWVWRSHTELPDHTTQTKVREAQAIDQDADVKLTEQAQARAGIVIAEAQAANMPLPAQAIATVLPLQDLIESAANVASMRAQLERAQAALEASRRDHERIKGLHAQDRNTSDRTLESAESTWRSDEASARAADAALKAAQASTRARWGSVLADAMTARRNPWPALESGKQVLLRVSPASGIAPAPMPSVIDVALLSGHRMKAYWVSPSPVTDPRVQSTAYFYAMDARDVAAGQVLQAHFAVGSAVSGAMLPSDALLWWQGRQWAYVEEAPGRFERRAAESAWRVEGGWFVPGFKPAKVVARGAQSLLAQELHSAIQVEEDEK
jgi:hypothetical protein